MARKRKKIKVKQIKVKPLRGKIFNTKNLNVLKNFGKYFAFLFLLAPATTFGAEQVIYDNSGGFDYGISSQSGEAIQNISCGEIYNGETGTPEITKISIPLKYAEDIMPPSHPQVPIIVKIYNNYDTTADLIQQFNHNVVFGDNGYVDFDFTNFVCSGEFAYSITIPTYAIYSLVGFGGVSTGVYYNDYDGESPFFDLKFTIYGDIIPPPVEPEGNILLQVPYPVASAIYGSGAYWENDQAGQYIDCDTLGNGIITEIGIALGAQARNVTVRFDVGDDIDSYYSITNAGIFIPANSPVSERVIVLDTPYDCSVEQGLYFLLQPEAIADGYGLLVGHSNGNAYDCNNGNTNCESWGPNGWNGTDRDIGFTVYGQEQTPPPPPEGETPTGPIAMALNLILISIAIWFGVEFIKVFYSDAKSGFTRVGTPRQEYNKIKAKHYKQDGLLTQKKYDKYYKKRHGRK